jgi:hypothetical protein
MIGSTISGLQQMLEEGRQRRIEQLRSRGWDAVRIQAQLEKDDADAQKWGASPRTYPELDLPAHSEQRSGVGFWKVVGAVLVGNIVTGLLALLVYALLRSM